MVYRAALNPPNGSRQAAIVGRQRTEHADAPHPLGLVRTCRERPGTHAAEKTDEFAPPHLKLFIVTKPAYHFCDAALGLCCSASQSNGEGW